MGFPQEFQNISTQGASKLLSPFIVCARMDWSICPYRQSKAKKTVGGKEMTQKRICLPHSVIVKSPGLLPMLYKVCELAIELHLPERTLRDWLEDGAPHQRDKRGQIWVYGPEFSNWVVGMRKPKREKKLADNQAYCFRCKQYVEMHNAYSCHLKGKLIMTKGICPQCGCIINRAGRIPDNQAIPASTAQPA
jgi:hypothetical protein